MDRTKDGCTNEYRITIKEQIRRALRFSRLNYRTVLWRRLSTSEPAGLIGEVPFRSRPVDGTTVATESGEWSVIGFREFRTFVSPFVGISRSSTDGGVLWTLRYDSFVDDDWTFGFGKKIIIDAGRIKRRRAILINNNKVPSVRADRRKSGRPPKTRSGSAGYALRAPTVGRAV